MSVKASPDTACLFGAQTQEGLPLVKGTDRCTETREVHSYMPKWAFQGDGYSAVSYSHPRIKCAPTLLHFLQAIPFAT